MNSYITIRKAELKFLQRPLSSCRRRGRQIRNRQTGSKKIIVIAKGSGCTLDVFTAGLYDRPAHKLAKSVEKNNVALSLKILAKFGTAIGNSNNL